MLFWNFKLKKLLSPKSYFLAQWIISTWNFKIIFYFFQGRTYNRRKRWKYYYKLRLVITQFYDRKNFRSEKMKYYLWCHLGFKMLSPKISSSFWKIQKLICYSSHKTPIKIEANDIMYKNKIKILDISREINRIGISTI